MLKVKQGTKITKIKMKTELPQTSLKFAKIIFQKESNSVFSPLNAPLGEVKMVSINCLASKNQPLVVSKLLIGLTSRY